MMLFPFRLRSGKEIFGSATHFWLQDMGILFIPLCLGCKAAKRTNGWVCFTLQVVSCLPCDDVSGNSAKYLAILMAPCPDGLSTDSPANNNAKRGRIVVNLKAVLHIVLAQP